MKKEIPIISKIDRRSFLKIGTVGSAGILLGLGVRCTPSEKILDPAWFEPNVFVGLNEKGEVTIIAHRSEMGQAVRTSLPTIVADEMEADWSKVKVKQSVGDEKKYGNQNTDGSFTIRMFYEPMRKVGATAKLMLEQAAAKTWGVNVSECKAKNHKVSHSSGKSLTFGELAQAASELPVPDESLIKLKKQSEFKYIGKNQKIVDLADIVTGNTVYGMDAKIDGMKIAMISRCPVAGGKVKSFDKSEAEKVPGVLKVYQMEGVSFPTGFDKVLGGIVVVAENTWAAIKGREALKIDWEYGINRDYNTDSYNANLLKASNSNGTILRENGEVKKVLNKKGKVLDEVYTVPHLAHAQMEPPAALAYFDETGKCQIQAPTQNPRWVRDAIASQLEMDRENVIVNITLLGGGFGRKSKPDFVVEAAKIAKETGEKIKLIWTREDDIQHDFVNASGMHRIKVAIDENNKVTAWNQHGMIPSIGGTANPAAKQVGAGEMSQGMVDMPFDIPNLCLETHEAPTKTRVGWLRSVHNIHNAFAIHTMVDEIAEARGMDKVQNYLDLIGGDRIIPFDKMVTGFSNYGEDLANYPWDTARLKNVLKMVAEKANYGKSLPTGKAQGVTVHRSFLTYVACVIEVDLTEKGKIRIPEVHYAVDCGRVVNPDRVISQFEGGANFAASGALRSAITFKDGAVEQSNFHDYQVARMTDSPEKVFVHLVESDEKPTGVGEPPVPPFAPALGNAIFAALGKRIRALPIEADKLWA